MDDSPSAPEQNVSKTSMRNQFATPTEIMIDLSQENIPKYDIREIIPQN